MTTIFEEAPSLLIAIIDVNPIMEDELENVNMQEILDSILLFIEAFLVSLRDNKILIIGVTQYKAEVVYPNITSLENEEGSLHDIVLKLQNLQLESEQKTKSFMDGNGLSKDISRCTIIPQAMSIALCYAQRIKREVHGIMPRILNFQISEDLIPYYNSVMNCIFAAERDSIPIDACILSKKHSVFMQQACDLTSGIYMKVEENKTLFQRMIFSFLPSTQCRKLLKMPKSTGEVDFTAACFCHRKMQKMAFVCSVCLSIFCEFSVQCKTCGTRAKPKRIGKRKAK